MSGSGSGSDAVGGRLEWREEDGNVIYKYDLPIYTSTCTCTWAQLHYVVVSCPDNTSHKKNSLANQVEFHGPITGMR